jgi:hypothetical protein
MSSGNVAFDRRGILGPNPIPEGSTTRSSSTIMWHFDPTFRNVHIAQISHTSRNGHDMNCWPVLMPGTDVATNFSDRRIISPCSPQDRFVAAKKAAEIALMQLTEVSSSFG